MDQTSKIKTTYEEPNQSTGVRRSTRSKVKFKEYYVPSMLGNTYEKVMAQLDKQGTLHPDEYLLFNLSVEEKPSVILAIMTQLYLKVGLKAWGDKLRKAMKSEMRQLHLRDTFEPRHHHEMSAKEKSEVLQSHMFLKLKRDGKIKVRSVAGGNKQIDFICKDESSSPTVATKAVLLSVIIDAQ